MRSLFRVLSGQAGPYRDIVLMNAAAAFVAGGHETELAVGLERAQSTDTKAAHQLLTNLLYKQITYNKMTDILQKIIEMKRQKLLS